MDKIDFIGTIGEGGKFTRGKEINAILQKHIGLKIKVTIEKAKKLRSTAQNNYYWGTVVPAIQSLLNHHGNDMDEEQTHYFLKEEVMRLSKNVIIPSTGEVKKVVGSTAILSTSQFIECIERCKAFAAENGVIIPEPKEVINDAN